MHFPGLLFFLTHSVGRDASLRGHPGKFSRKLSRKYFADPFSKHHGKSIVRTPALDNACMSLPVLLRTRNP